MLAKAKPGEIARGPLWIVVEGADGDRGYSRLNGNMTAKVLVGPVETQWPEVRRHEIRALRRQDLEADLAKRGPGGRACAAYRLPELES